MITVFYDGKCGLCAREINYYRQIAPDGVFKWQDITESSSELNEQGISLAQGLRLLHIKDHHGQLHIGANAFIQIWKQIKYWKILGHIISLPGIRQLANLAYNLFANWKFQRLAHCQIAAKEESSS